MRILYILKHDPWGIGGGCFACRNYLDAFSDIFDDAELDILYCSEFAITEKYSTDRRNFIPIVPMDKKLKVMSLVTGVINRFHVKTLALMNKNDYDFCIFDHSSIAGSLAVECKRKGIKTIVVNHNYEYEYYKGSHPQWYKRMLILPLIRRNENLSYKKCDVNVFLTREDIQLFRNKYGLSETVCILGGCFEQKKASCTRNSTNIVNTEHRNIRLVISGTMGNVQNMDGIDYFLNELYPLLPMDIDVVLTGKNPPKSLVDRIKNGVHGNQKTPIQDIYDAGNGIFADCQERVSFRNVTLIPNPENIQEIVASCDIYVCPARLGGGMKLRVMDGLRNGLPVICHHVSARGYESFMQRGMCLSYSTAEEFVEAVKTMVLRIRNNEMTKNKVMNYYSETMGYENKVKTLRNEFKRKGILCSV